MKWLVTGAGGFVGRALVRRLVADPTAQVCASGRLDSSPLAAGLLRAVATEIGPDTDWQGDLQGVEVVVHLAARVHVTQETAIDPMAEYQRVNVHGTMNLARQAAQAGVRRLVFVSSIKVNGESTEPAMPFRADDEPAPQDCYGRSKLQAEDGLRALARTCAMEVVVVRPPLVYGPGVQANFRALIRAVALGWPLPLGAVDNLRSFVALDNLVDLLVVCASHPAAAGQTLLVSDGCDLSTSDLLRRIAQAMGRPARLWPLPVPLLIMAARLAGRGGMAQRLCRNLQVDISRTRGLLGWTPPVGVDEALRRTVSQAVVPGASSP